MRLAQVLEKLSPSQKEQKETLAVYEKVEKKILKHIGKKTLLVGSVAKNTYLAGQKDLDVFIPYPPTFSEKKLETHALAEIKKALKGYELEEHWAQHPYLKAKIDDYDVELVPFYEIKDTSQIVSAVDRSPFHTQYVKKKLSQKNLRKDILLLKAFMKTADVYGAEEKIQGFSGYLTELLVIHYGGFQETMKAVAEWRLRETIVLEKKPKKKFKEPLVVVDPTDSNRNVASAVSQDALANLIISARKYLAKPSEKFFFPKKTKPATAGVLKKLSERGTQTLLIEFPKPKVVEEILYSQAKKTLNSFEKILENQDFRVMGKTFSEQEKKCFFLLELVDQKLPKIKKHFGPPVQKKQDAERFQTKHKKTWIENGRLCTEIRRKHTTPKQVLEFVLKKPSSFGIASHFRELAKKATVSEKTDNKEKQTAVAEYLNRA